MEKRGENMFKQRSMSLFKIGGIEGTIGYCWIDSRFEPNLLKAAYEAEMTPTDPAVSSPCQQALLTLSKNVTKRVREPPGLPKVWKNLRATLPPQVETPSVDRAGSQMPDPTQFIKNSL